MNSSLFMLADDVRIGQLIIWGILLIGAAAGGWQGVMWYRRQLSQDDETGGGSAGFTLADLREMVSNGQMSEAEFEKARQQLIVATQRDTERKAREAAEKAASAGAVQKAAAMGAAAGIRAFPVKPVDLQNDLPKAEVAAAGNPAVNAMPRILCKACGQQSPVDAVACISCGARLDLSNLIRDSVPGANPINRGPASSIFPQGHRDLPGRRNRQPPAP